MNELTEDADFNIFDAIARVALVPSRLSLYPAALKLEVSRAIPTKRLCAIRVELLGEGLRIKCAIRTWDTVGRFYHAYLDPNEPGVRTSFVPAPDLTGCTKIRLIVEEEGRDLENDRALAKEPGE